MAAPINPAQILNSYRKTDAVVIVCQNNAKKVIEIAAINEEAAFATGYTNEDLVGKPLALLLPERVSSTVAEFVEFKENKNDLFLVLSKIRNFSIKTRDGREKEFKLRIIHGAAIDNNPWFHLVLIDEEKLRKSNTFREILRENFKGHEVLDERTGLPNRASLIKDLEMVVYYVRNKDISGIFAVMDINDYDAHCKQYDEKTCLRLHEHIGKLCRQKLRPEDTVGTLSDRTLGIILIDAPQEPAHMVLNRLRWAISVSPLHVKEQQELLAQVNIGYAQVDGKLGHSEVLEKCEAFIEDIRPHANNSIQLVVTHERRKQNTSVAVDKRKKTRKNGDPETPRA